jgi:PadR family transcriptional regulator PadR
MPGDGSKNEGSRGWSPKNPKTIEREFPLQGDVNMPRPMGMSSLLILAALEARVCYGLDLTQRTGLLPGTVYTTLRRLEKRSLVRGEWEVAEIAEAERRPRRRYYSLTTEGQMAFEASRERIAALPITVGARMPGMVEGE